MILRIKQLTLLFGDIVALYASLFVMIGLRYGMFSAEYVGAHLMPFTVVFACWLIIFYIAGLYDFRWMRSNFETARLLFTSIAAGAAFAVFLFYTVPYFHISPKWSLAIFTAVYAAIGFLWRLLFSKINPAYRRNVVIVGQNRETEELYQAFKDNPYMGYSVVGYLNASPLLTNQELQNTLSKYNTSLIVIAKQADIPPHIREEIYRAAARGMEIIESSELYEAIFKKLSLEFYEDLATIAPQTRQKKIFDMIKSPTETAAAAILLVALSPVLLLIYALVRLTSRGPGIYHQLRFGKFQKKFPIYKFRTMVQNAEQNGPQWAERRDPRVTPLGRFLRYAHLDELPQLMNIVRNDLSFVGPRAERPEFVQELLQKIPHYELRHIIKPGITGWAQINYKYGSSVEDARAKLQYDLYYLKHRSFFMDLLIILKTIKHFFANL